MRRRTVVALAAIGAIVTLPSCGDSPTSPGLEVLPAEVIPLLGGSSLLFHNAAAIVEQRAAIEQVVRDTVALVRTLIPIDGVRINIGVGTANVIPELGFGGRADANDVFLTFEPDSPALATSVVDGLFGLLAHELHHTARMRTVGYGSNLLGAMVSEGLADQFAVEVTGGAPPMWSVALTGEQLAAWSTTARSQWFDTAYDHSAWFFGTGGAIPRWTGYSIGFDITGRFLAVNPSRRASELHNEPASSFIPPS